MTLTWLYKALQWTTQVGTPSAERKRSVYALSIYYPLTIAQEDEYYRHQHHAHEQVGPMDEAFIGGFRRQGHSSPVPPALPPKDFHMGPAMGPGFPTQTTITPGSLSHLSAVERSQTLRYARMEPHLQVCRKLPLEFGWPDICPVHVRPSAEVGVVRLGLTRLNVIQV